MQISIIGQHINLGNSLQEYIKSKVNEIGHKYFPHPIWTKIHFNKSNGYQIHCDIIINEGSGHHYSIKSDAICDEIYSSFDLALTKLKKQLRKYKSKLHNRHAKIKPSEITESLKYEINPYSEIVDEDKEDIENNNPVIIAEKNTIISTLSVSQAVMIMDLESLPALVFKNSQTHRINVVYYKKSGNIAWIDTPNL